MAVTTGGVALGLGVGGLILSGYNAYNANEKMEDANAQNEQAMAAQNEIMQQQLKLSEDQWNNYLTTFQPINEMLAIDAKRGVTAKYDKRIDEANNDVEMSFAQSEGTARRNLMRYGVNPNDPRFADMTRKSGIQKSLAKVGAVNNARQTERDRTEKLTWAKRMDVASIGKGIQGNAVASLNSAGNTARGLNYGAGVSANLAKQSADDTYRFANGITSLGFKVADYGEKNNWWSSKDNLDYLDTDSAYNDHGYDDDYADGGLIEAEPSRKPLMIGGREFGGDHGMIEGPGSGTSDSVKAVVDGFREVNLSDGEFIIPADIVRKKGTEFFEKMISQDHQQVKRG